MEVRNGNLFDSSSQVMAHQVNCLGLMGSGVAKEVGERYPEVYNAYKQLCSGYRGREKELLGYAQFVQQGNVYVCNLFGQQSINRQWYLGGQVTDLAALRGGFSKVRKFMEENKLKTLGIPYMFGCVRGGAKWEDVVGIIDSIFQDSDIEVTAYKL